MKNIKIFGKSIPVFVVALVALSTFGSAALLTYYGQITTTANVQQSILVDGQPWDAQITHEIPEAAPGGEEFCFKHTVENMMSVNGDVEFDITYNNQHARDGIVTGIYNIPETTLLRLCQKEENASGYWNCVDGGMTAELEYKTSNPKFEGTLTTSGLDDGRNYALVYYPDKNPRFEEWGGEDGVVIKEFTGDYNGIIDVDLGMNFPITTDWNVNPDPDYCDYHNGKDDYEHCRGAKFWIVTVDDLTDGEKLPVINWENHEDWLFETDLVMYLDCNEQTEDGISRLVSFFKDTEITESLELEPGETKNFLICHDFDSLIVPGDYWIETSVIPAD